MFWAEVPSAGDIVEIRSGSRKLLLAELSPGAIIPILGREFKYGEKYEVVRRFASESGKSRLELRPVSINTIHVSGETYCISNKWSYLEYPLAEYFLIVQRYNERSHRVTCAN